MNLLGWAMVCPYAMKLLWHGTIPLDIAVYPTAEESKHRHDMFGMIVEDQIRSGIFNIIDEKHEYEHGICFQNGEDELCARSKADYVYLGTLERTRSKNRLITIYLEISSSRINVAKPWQAILRGISLYYERRIPVGIIIVSPERMMFKILDDQDQRKVIKRINAGLRRDAEENWASSSNLCSLCELLHYCPYRLI
ncbi:MAG: hypothetical protein ACP5GN_07475 [Fervidicoccaceae archaeon]